MHVTVKADYAIRAVVELVDSSQERPFKIDAVAQAQGIPLSFLVDILVQLRSAGVVRSQRGRWGGYWLARPPDELNIAQIIRAVEGPLVGVRGQPPEEIEYVGSAESLQAGVDRGAGEHAQSSRACDHRRCRRRRVAERRGRAHA